MDILLLLLQVHFTTRQNFFCCFLTGQNRAFVSVEGSIQTKAKMSSRRKNKPVMAFHRLYGGFLALDMD